MLNPVFSLKHMRDLIPVFYPIAHKVSIRLLTGKSADHVPVLCVLQLRDILENQVRSGKEEINVMLWMSRAALEYIGQGGLGYSFDALNEHSTNTYSEAIKMFV